MSENYILKWREGKNPERVWFLRGLTPDGRLYGEVTVRARSGVRQVTIVGRIPSDRMSRLREMLEAVEQASDRRSSAPWTGLLAKGPVDHPTVLLQYALGDEASSKAAGDFLRIVGLLSQSVSSQVARARGRHTSKEGVSRSAVAHIEKAIAKLEVELRRKQRMLAEIKSQRAAIEGELEDRVRVAKSGVA